MQSSGKPKFYSKSNVRSGGAPMTPDIDFVMKYTNDDPLD